jgi:hypothetical protein
MQSALSAQQEHVLLLPDLPLGDRPAVSVVPHGDETVLYGGNSSSA